MAETPIFICVPPREAGQLELNIPGVGALRAAKTTIDGLPTPMSLAMVMLGQANPVIAPFIPLLRVVDLLGTIIQSLKDVTNPIALAEDINKLVKEVGFLTEFLPGIQYVRTIRDMLIIAEEILLGCSDLINRWVIEMQAITLALQNAALINDADLQFSATCAGQRLIETQQATQASLRDVGQFLKLIKLIADIISSAVPVPLPGIHEMADTVDTLVNTIVCTPANIATLEAQAGLLVAAEQLHALGETLHHLTAHLTNILG